jgi:molybdate transport system ATP-binding protein
VTIAAKFRIERPRFSLMVDLVFPARAVTALLGPSGCGKTTFLRAMAGLEYHRSGFLKVGSMIWQDQNRFVPTHQRPIGFVFQEASLFNHLTVKQNVAYGVKRVPKTDRKVSVEQAIELLGIEHLLERRPNTLSGGERQRVAIARALAVSPRLLLMDEPLASLEVARKREILPYIASLHKELNIPVVYVSHSPEEVARLADHVVLLEAGRVVAVGDVYDMYTRSDLPLARGSEAVTIIEAMVAGHDGRFALTYLDFEGGRFSVPRKRLSIGSHVRLQVAAQDVSLTLAPQTGTTILNMFPTTIEALTPEDDSLVTVRLRVAGKPLLARVTRKSISLLDLQPGKRVYAQVKSVALLT